MDILFSDYTLFLFGLILLLVSAEFFVRNAVSLANFIGRSSLFIGLTVAAIGTSAPELAVGVISLLKGQAAVGMGNIVGSNIFNIFFVLGLGAVISPIVIKRPTVWRDIPILLTISIIFYIAVLNGSINKLEAIILLLLLFGYLYYLYRTTSIQEKKDPENSDDADFPIKGWPIVLKIIFIIGSIGLMMFSSRLMVTSSVNIALKFGMSEFVIGLTIIAVGTSLPEIATTLIAIKKRQYELALGNVIGSCFFNLLAVHPVMALISKGSLIVEQEAIFVDIPIMIFAVVACFPIFFSGHKISRSEGFLFLFYYLIFVLILYFRTATDSFLSQYLYELLFLGLPILIVTVFIITFRAIQYRGKKDA